MREVLTGIIFTGLTVGLVGVFSAVAALFVLIWTGPR